MGLKNYEVWAGIESKIKHKCFEQTLHFVHKFGWANVWPDEFGISDYTSSTVCKETAALQCVQPGWWHPNNKCP